MEYRFQASAPAAQLEADCMVVGIYKDRDAALSRAAAQLDQASAGGLGAHLALGDFNARKHETQLLYGLTGIKARRVLLVGLGERAKLTSEVLAQASRTAARQLKSANIRHAVSFLSDESGSEHRAEAVRQAIRAVAEALYSFNAYKSGEAENDRTALAQWDIAHTEAGDLSAAIQQGQAIAAGCHLARDLGNLPGNVCTPAYLAETASGLVNEHAGMMQVEILEESDMEALGMGAFMSVSKGSSQPGKLVSIHYNGGRQGDAPVVLVGKGITFDTGGISIKPGLKMDEMKYDMSGAGSVLGTMKAIAAMRLPLNVIGMLAAAENMPSGHASKPGDIVTTLSGKTVEILNTDAEGRLVLCDALTYAERYSPAAVVDIATLTGAVIVALGNHISGLMSNDEALAKALQAAGQIAGDETWRLPLGEKYQEQLKSNFADMANIGGPSAGTITAGCFLARFAENFPWAHLDVAGVAWDGGSNKGSTARPVPLLTQFLMARAGIAA